MLVFPRLYSHTLNRNHGTHLRQVVFCARIPHSIEMALLYTLMTRGHSGSEQIVCSRDYNDPVEFSLRYQGVEELRPFHGDQSAPADNSNGVLTCFITFARLSSLPNNKLSRTSRLSEF